jgi:hypothetical protein
MGKEILKGTIPFDRNIARLEIFSEGEDRDQWRIVINFQDALYDGNVRVDEPRFGTENVAVTYGEIKDMALPSGGKVSDMFAPIRALGYALLQRQDDRRDAAVKAAAEAAAKTKADANNTAEVES